MINQGMDALTVLARIEDKLDDIRDRVTSMEISSGETKVKQAVHDREIAEMKHRLADMQTAIDKARGALYIVGAPGVLSGLYALAKLLGK